MSITFETKKLAQAVSSLNRIAPSKLLEITFYWHIFGDGETVFFTAYDGSNWIRYAIEGNQEIDVIVKADQFGKLVEKTTVDTIKLSQKDGYLEVKANGTYKVEIVTGDEEYPSFDELLPEELPEDEAKQVATSLFWSIANINDSAVSKSTADGIYTGFKIDDDLAITSDMIRICLNPIEPTGLKVLLQPSLMKLLSTVSDEYFDIWEVDDSIYAVSDTVEIFGRLMEGLEDYQDMSIMDQQEFTGKVKLPTVPIQNILERLTLFMSAFDKGTINFEFGPTGLTISTTTGSDEKVNYVELGKTKQPKFKCLLNSLLLRDILATINDEHFTLEYGSDLVLRITAKGVTYYLALQDEE